MKKTIINTCLGLALCSSLFAGPAEDIAKKHATLAATEMVAYLKANPNAPDKDKAHQILLQSYTTLGQPENTIIIFRDKFDSSGSGADADISKLYYSGRSLFGLLLKNDRVDEAVALVEEAIKKSAGHPKEAQLISAYKLLKAQLNTPRVGDTMEMKFTSLQGKDVDLAAMKGKVVLVDFWATWCGPCVQEIPHVKKAYEEYHEKGFEVIAISVDKEADRAKLETFIKDQKIPWPQHFDGKGSSNEFAMKYGINSYPSTFLIGKEGKVIATNLRGAALSEALAKQLPESKEAK